MSIVQISKLHQFTVDKIVQDGNFDQLQYLVDQFPVEIDKFLHTGLMADAVRSGNVKLVQLLLECESPITVYDDYVSISILEGHIEMTDFILKHMHKFVTEPYAPLEFWHELHHSKIITNELIDVLVSNGVHWCFESFNTYDVQALQTILEHPRGISQFDRCVFSIYDDNNVKINPSFGNNLVTGLAIFPDYIEFLLRNHQRFQYGHLLVKKIGELVCFICEFEEECQALMYNTNIIHAYTFWFLQLIANLAEKNFSQDILRHLLASCQAKPNASEITSHEYVCISILHDLLKQ